MHSNIEADVYGECRDIDGFEESGDAGMAHVNAQTRDLLCGSVLPCTAISKRMYMREQ